MFSSENMLETLELLSLQDIFFSAVFIKDFNT